MNAQKKILVMQTDAGIGDVARYACVMKAIADAAPEHEIVLMTLRSTCADQIFAETPYVREVVWMKNRPLSLKDMFQLSAKLRSYRFQEAWILSRSRSLTLAAALARIPRIFAFGNVWPSRWIVHPPELPKEHRKSHIVVQANVFLRQHGLDAHPENHKITPKRTDVLRLRQSLAAYPRPWICLGFGSTDYRRMWPQENFASLANALSRPGRNTLFLCGASPEAGTARWIQNAVHSAGKEVVLATDFTLSEMMALLSLADWFIGNDSGLLNLAPALGTPSLGIFRVYGVAEYSLPVIAAVGEAYNTAWGFGKHQKKIPFSAEEISVDEVLSGFERLSQKYGNTDQHDAALRELKKHDGMLHNPLD